MTTVFVERIPRRGPNGDRATTTQPYFDYNIHVLRAMESPSKVTKVHEVLGYDNWHSHILNRDETRTEAIEYAAKLADRIGGKVEMQSEKLKHFQVALDISVLAENEKDAITQAMSRLDREEAKFVARELTA